MKELPKQFKGKGKVKGYDFNQITATPYGYIYAKTSLEGTNTFEVFKRLENDVYNCISYPTDKAFGIWAWNTGSIERANEILESITEREKLKRAKELDKLDTIKEVFREKEVYNSATFNINNMPPNLTKQANFRF